MQEKKQFTKFLLSLYKPVRIMTVIMVISMIFSQFFNLLKTYIIKGIIDLPLNSNFQISDLYYTLAILMLVILIEIIFFYVSNITRTIIVVKKQTPYIVEKLFNNLNRKKYSFFAD